MRSTISSLLKSLSFVIRSAAEVAPCFHAASRNHHLAVGQAVVRPSKAVLKARGLTSKSSSNPGYSAKCEYMASPQFKTPGFAMQILMRFSNAAARVESAPHAQSHQDDALPLDVR